MTNETINLYHVAIGDNTGIICAKKAYEVRKRKVLAKNDYYICLEDHSFTSLEIKNIGKPSIHSYANDNVWGNRITYRLYSYKNVRPSTIKRQIEKYIKDKYGFFSKDLDLSFIGKKESEVL